MIASRRSFLFAAAGVIAAPAIVRAVSLMPVKALINDLLPHPTFIGTPICPLVGDFSADNLIVRSTERYVIGYTDFRAVLLPGVQEIFSGTYGSIPDAWTKAFAS